MHNTIFSFFSVIFILIFVSCQEDDAERPDVIWEGSVSFNIENQATKTGSLGDDAYKPQFVIPLKQEGEIETVGYGILNAFALDAFGNESLKIQLYQIMEVENNIQNLDSLFLHHINANEGNFIEDMMEYRGFGMVMEYTDSEQTIWYSSKPLGNSLEVDQTGSMIDFYEVAEQGSEYFFKAKFNCNVFNEKGGRLTIESGEFIFEL